MASKHKPRTVQVGPTDRSSTIGLSRDQKIRNFLSNGQSITAQITVNRKKKDGAIERPSKVDSNNIVDGGRATALKTPKTPPSISIQYY